MKGQRESFALKGKPIPRRAALAEAMFMAELKSLILTAGHDLDAAPAVRVDVTTDGARYLLLNGKLAMLERGDMMMVDAGIIFSLLRGPGHRTASPPRPSRRALRHVRTAGNSE